MGKGGRQVSVFQYVDGLHVLHGHHYSYFHVTHRVFVSYLALNMSYRNEMAVITVCHDEVNVHSWKLKYSFIISVWITINHSKSITQNNAQYLT